LDPRRATRAFQSASSWSSWWQIANSFGPFLALVAAIYWCLPHSLPLTLALTIPAAAFVVRIFIIQHDCGHGSFFRQAWANNAVGRVCSMVTWTPYAMWRRQHAGHHGHWNNLDARGTADLYSSCLTVAEYKAMAPGARWRWRLLQEPLVALFLLPPLVFLALYRTPFDAPTTWRRERRGVYLTNLALLTIYGALAAAFGVLNVAMVHGAIMLTASTVGVWLFSVQHRFEKAVWSRQETWTAADASLRGTSYLVLPRWLNWITGNIGFHHVHHLNPHIPNYRLAKCHRAVLKSAEVRALTLSEAARSWRYALWDEARNRMCTVREASHDNGC
jgi:omega-6 fatty acid desaturase (delta-12 desaturase)